VHKLSYAALAFALRTTGFGHGLENAGLESILNSFVLCPSASDCRSLLTESSSEGEGERRSALSIHSSGRHRGGYPGAGA